MFHFLVVANQLFAVRVKWHSQLDEIRIMHCVPPHAARCVRVVFMCCIYATKGFLLPRQQISKYMRTGTGVSHWC